MKDIIKFFFLSQIFLFGLGGYFFGILTSNDLRSTLFLLVLFVISSVGYLLMIKVFLKLLSRNYKSKKNGSLEES